jgi:hypothetical protein
MGLDMYAFTIKRRPSSEVDFKANNKTELFYWRKHPNLHGWMEQLYRAKGGADHDFNLVNLQLTGLDIDLLELDIRASRLPRTSGFFFGESDGSERDNDLRFIAAAREALAAKLTVLYTAWW